ncbi:MAG: hypothetical protein ACYTF7_05445 [Planctomycetota bacterium]|jgi:hypothetical protein
MFARTLSTLVISTLLAFTSHAKLPDVANHIPDDAPIAIVVPSLNGLNDQIQTALTALEMPGMFTLEQGLATVGFREGIDFNGSAAIIVPLSALENDGDGVIGLFPVTDYDAFVAQFNAVVDNGIASFTLNDDPAVAKPLGNYAVLADSADYLNAFTGNGDAAALEAKMGAKVNSIANTSGLYMIINHEPIAEAIGPMLDEFVGTMKADLEGGLNDADLEDLGDMDPDAIVTFMEEGVGVLEDLISQSTVTVIGAEISAFGYSIDAATSFTPGSEWGNLVSAQGDSSNYLNLLPNKPFIFASSVDMSMPQFKEATASMMESFQPFMEQLAEFGGEQILAAFNPEIVGLTDGQVQAMFVPEGGIMGGLLSGTTRIDVSSDPQSLHEHARGMIEAMVGGGMMGAGAEFTLEQDAVDVGDAKADAWAMTLDPGAMGANPMAGQFMGMFFGPTGGPAGLLMQGPRGIYSTYSQDPSVMQELLSVTPENSLGADPGIVQVRGFLPENTMAEFYFSVQDTIDMALPMAAMFGMAIDLPETNMPPIGAGVATGNNEVHGRLFVPMPVIQGMAQIGMAAQQQMMQQGGDDGNPPF